MRIRPPPSARRMANSLRRARPRASSIDARFRHTVSSTAPVMPIITAPSVASTPSSDGRRAGPELRQRAERQARGVRTRGRTAPHPGRAGPGRPRRCDISTPSFSAPDQEQVVGIDALQRPRGVAGEVVREGVEDAQREEQLRAEHAHRAGETARGDADDRELTLVDADASCPTSAGSNPVRCQCA